jgi:leucyl aminopeptidase (aminopeptidase T)
MQIVGLTEEDMYKGAIEANFLETRELGEKIGNVLREAKEVHVTNPAGTDIYFDFKGQGENVRTFTNICHAAGQFGVMNLEVAISPNVGTAHGVIVCDASVTLFRGLLKESIRAVVETGRVTEITGGAEALRVAIF